MDPDPAKTPLGDIKIPEPGNKQVTNAKTQNTQVSSNILNHSQLKV
jgi:hypothetical protein